MKHSIEFWKGARAALAGFWLCCGMGHAAMARDQISLDIAAADGDPPYSYVENNELKGIYTAIIRKALLKMPEYRANFVAVPWKRGLLMLETGKTFALYPPYMRPDERPYMGYSEPIFLEQHAVFCTKAVSNRRALKAWPDDYFGLRIGINTGSLVGGKPFHDNVANGNFTVETVRETRINLLKLLNGRIDCLLHDRLAVVLELGRIRSEGLAQPVAQDVIQTATLNGEQAYLGFNVREDARFPFSRDFFKKFNAALKDMKKDGVINDIVEQFFAQP